MPLDFDQRIPRPLDPNAPNRLPTDFYSGVNFLGHPTQISLLGAEPGATVAGAAAGGAPTAPTAATTGLAPSTAGQTPSAARAGAGTVGGAKGEADTFWQTILGIGEKGLDALSRAVGLSKITPGGLPPYGTDLGGGLVSVPGATGNIGAEAAGKIGYGGATGLEEAPSMTPTLTGQVSSLASKAAPWIAPATLLYGLAMRDPTTAVPAAVGSATEAAALGAGSLAASQGTATGTALGGALAGGTAAAGTAAALGGALALVPAISMIVGGMREASIERKYRSEAKRAIADLQANPIIQNPVPALQAIAAGGDTGPLADLAVQSIRAGNAAAQPEGGSPYGVYGSVSTPLFEWMANHAPGSYGQFLTQVASRLDPSFDQDVNAAWRAVQATGVGAPRPSGYRPSSVFTAAALATPGGQQLAQAYDWTPPAAPWTPEHIPDVRSQADIDRGTYLTYPGNPYVVPPAPGWYNAAGGVGGVV